MKYQIRKFLMQCHYRLGVIAALFILMLSITGLMLNNSQLLGLSEHSLNSKFLLKSYGIKTPTFVGVNTSKGWVSQLNTSNIYLDLLNIGRCNTSLVGAVMYNEALIIACHNMLLITTLDGEFIEDINTIHGLPDNILNIALSENGLILLDIGNDIVTADLLNMTFTSAHTKIAENIIWQRIITSLPTYIENKLIAQYKGRQVTLERFILDIHSGSFFGKAGSWAIDAAAVIFIFLAFSGGMIFIGRIKRK